jgi:putative transposase
LRRTGHLWQARFHSVEKHFWAAMLYIEQNPVRAGLVQHAAEWAWSSARAHLGLEANTLLDLLPWRTRFDASRWNEWLSGGERDAVVEQRIRSATLCGVPLGDEQFRNGLKARFGIASELSRPGRPKKAVSDQRLASSAA